MRLFPCLLFTLAVLGFCRAADATLTWPQKTITLKATGDSTVMEARYHFTNAGAKPVEIQNVESSCGCTTAELEKRHYEPGESGDIVARFTIGSRVGRQTKTIAVKTSDLPEPETLTLIVDIPELLRIRPLYVYWIQGAEPKAKTMTLELQPGSPAEKITVETSNPAMTPALKEVVKGLQYELTVTPTSTEKVAFSALTLQCTFRGAKEPKAFRAYATVKPAEIQPE